MMKFETMLYCRIDKALKRQLTAEAARLRRRGLVKNESDVTRLALVEYFEARDARSNGKALPA